MTSLTLPKRFVGAKKINLTVLADDTIRHCCRYLDLKTIVSLQRCNHVLLRIVRDPRTMAQIPFSAKAWRDLSRYLMSSRSNFKLDYTPYSMLKEVDICFVLVDQYSYQLGRTIVAPDMFRNLVVGNMERLEHLVISSQRKSRGYCSAANSTTIADFQVMVISSGLQFPSLKSLKLSTRSTEIGLSVLGTFHDTQNVLEKISFGSYFGWSRSILDALQRIPFGGELVVEDAHYLCNHSRFSFNDFPTLLRFRPRSLRIVPEGARKTFSAQHLASWLMLCAPCLEELAVASSALVKGAVKYPRLQNLSIWHYSRSAVTKFHKLSDAFFYISAPRLSKMHLYITTRLGMESFWCDTIWRAIACIAPAKQLSLKVVFSYIYNTDFPLEAKKKVLKAVYRQRDFVEKMNFSNYSLMFRLNGPLALWEDLLIELDSRGVIDAVDSYCDFCIYFSKGTTTGRVTKDEMDYFSDSDESLAF